MQDGISCSRLASEEQKHRYIRSCLFPGILVQQGTEALDQRQEKALSEAKSLRDSVVYSSTKRSIATHSRCSLAMCAHACHNVLTNKHTVTQESQRTMTGLTAHCNAARVWLSFHYAVRHACDQGQSRKAHRKQFKM